METKANYVLVGIFTLAVLILAFLLVYTIGRFGETSNLKPLNIRIPGSAVTGLDRGSLVYFNGIRVGQVKSLRLDDKNPNMVIARTEVNGTTPVTRSTEASLGSQGVTGVAYVELKGGSLNEPNLLTEAEKSNSVARIDADPSALNNLLVSARDIASHTNAVLRELEAMVKDLRQPLTNTVKNMETFSDTLKDNKDDLKKMIADIGTTAERFSKASERVDSIMAKLDLMLSPDNRDGVVVQARETLTSIREAVDTFTDHVEPIANNLEHFSGQGLRNIEAFVLESRRSIERIERALTDFEKNPQRILYGGEGTVPQYDGRARR